MTLSKMCEAEKAIELAYFCEEVENMKFGSKPNYKKLIKMLEDLYNHEKNKQFNQ